MGRVLGLSALIFFGCSDPGPLVDADGSPVDAEPRPVVDTSAPDMAPPVDALMVDQAPPPAPPDAGPDEGIMEAPCDEAPEGTVLVAGALTPCVALDEWPCDPRGHQSLEEVVCRGGEPREETRMVACEVAPPGCEEGVPTRRIVGMPRIHDLSGAPSDQVDLLVARALEGLGLDAETGPSVHDRVVVGRWFLAWIDETGFYGKMNGLWPLNGDLDNLGFVLLDGVRPINALVVGEDGEGTWPAGYMGAEHLEFPNPTPEPDDDPGCADTFCAQYSLAEAPLYTVPAIPTWRACNAGSPQWSDRFTPISVEYDGAALTLLYEGPLTKRADMGGDLNGANCHADYLFPDGVRRRVDLRVGYRLDPAAHAVDRLIAIRNPEGNPPFDGPYGIIGGFVMTRWPDPPPQKAINAFLRVEEEPVRFQWSDYELVVDPGRWFRLPHRVPDHDVILGWAGQPVTLSTMAGPLLGGAFTVSNHGLGNPDDTGFCLCRVHGGVELGGGVLHGPIAPGETEEAVRRLTLRHERAEPPAPGPWRWVYEAEAGGPLRHEVGRAQDDGWSADTGPDQAGHMVFGPYDTHWPAGPLEAEFQLMVDVVDGPDGFVVTVDIFDSDTQEQLASLPVRRSAFRAPFAYQAFTLPFDNRGRAGHAMEARVFWHDISYVRVDRVTITAR